MTSMAVAGAIRTAVTAYVTHSSPTEISSRSPMRISGSRLNTSPFLVIGLLLWPAVTVLPRVPGSAVPRW
jgi:hypothetical protein